MGSLWRRSFSPSSGGRRGEGGHFSFEKRSVPPRPPKRNPGGFRISTPSRHCDSRPLFGAANRAASSKQARFIRRWRRFACFPHTPLKRLKGEGLRPLPFGFPSRNGRGSAKRSGERGKRSKAHTSTAPESRCAVPNAGEYVLCFWEVRRTRRKPGKFLPHRFARPPHLSKKGTKGAVLRSSAFSFDRERPFVSA